MEIIFINQSEEPSWKNYKAYLKPLLEKTLKMLSLPLDVSVSVVLVDDASIHAFNKDFRSVDRPTDVLSFPDGEETEGVLNLGDIIISVDALRRQAKEYGHTLKREFSFLVVHGYLHLLGYDHETKEDEEAMFSLQKEILSGIADRHN